MKRRAIPAGVSVAVLGLTFAMTAWHAGLVSQADPPTVEPQSTRLAGSLQPKIGLQPWFGATTRPVAAPSSIASGSPALPQPQLTLAQSDPPATPEAGVAEDSATDDSPSAIGEPAEEESYLEARDRATAHSARLR